MSSDPGEGLTKKINEVAEENQDLGSVTVTIS
jgi:hypothetical protein